MSEENNNKNKKISHEKNIINYKHPNLNNNLHFFNNSDMFSLYKDSFKTPANKWGRGENYQRKQIIFQTLIQKHVKFQKLYQEFFSIFFKHDK